MAQQIFRTAQPSRVAMIWHDRIARLRRLEAEAIYIIRETVAEFAKPVMLYSVGKDSGVLLHIARRII